MMLFDFPAQLDPTLNAATSQPLSLSGSLPPSSIDRTALGVSPIASSTRSAPITADPTVPTLAAQSIDLFADFDLAGLNAVLALSGSAASDSAVSTSTIVEDWLVLGL